MITGSIVLDEKNGTISIRLLDGQSLSNAYPAGAYSFLVNALKTIQATANKQLFRKALDMAGYHGQAATAENVRKCLSDYVDAGVFRDMDLSDINEYTPEEMARGLIRYCK